jgi:hypothetical protein
MPVSSAAAAGAPASPAPEPQPRRPGGSPPPSASPGPIAAAAGLPGLDGSPCPGRGLRPRFTQWPGFAHRATPAAGRLPRQRRCDEPAPTVRRSQAEERFDHETLPAGTSHRMAEHRLGIANPKATVAVGGAVHEGGPARAGCFPGDGCGQERSEGSVKGQHGDGARRAVGRAVFEGNGVEREVSAKLCGRV